ncbi:tetratricopeptide repeat protein [Devosia sp.]|uniref:tetratricopeptide repeat protein n=1 Tax=Devosia sp. TaxID=1871048 RepID=UPI0026153531|nr:tetratricopeptide repeat protein [Devosia sp.]
MAAFLDRYLRLNDKGLNGNADKRNDRVLRHWQTGFGRFVGRDREPVKWSAQMRSQTQFTNVLTRTRSAIPAEGSAKMTSDIRAQRGAMRSERKPRRLDGKFAGLWAGKRSMMRVIRDQSLISATAALIMMTMSVTMAPAYAQTAADAALGMANMLDGAGGGVSRDDLLGALEDAADAGQPMAMWQLGTMYENGEGVEKDQAKAFGYFSQIANQHADAAPKGIEADIVAQSFVKVGEYYRDGLPGAGIQADANRSHALLLHAASYFGDADAQYRVGELYMEEGGLGINPLQSARWFSLAARKGHALAQAKLGDLLFNGIQGLAPQPVEGLMWLTLAHKRVAGTADADWVDELLNRAMSVATADQRSDAVKMADTLGTQFGGL